MNSVLACIDGSMMAADVCDAAAWVATRLHTPLTFLHVLDRADFHNERDLSGSLGFDSREHLLEELVTLDERRSKLALEHGKLLLADAQRRVISLGIDQVSILQRHGRLLDTLIDQQETTRLLVMGRQGEGHDSAAQAIGSQLENVVRTVNLPILIAVEHFTPPASFMLAFDGSPAGEKVVQAVATSPLLRDLPCHLVTVVREGESSEQSVNKMTHELIRAGYDVTNAVLTGDINSALQRYQMENAIDLIVMGAYGHSRIRQFFVGSNTTRMITYSDISLLLLR